MKNSLKNWQIDALGQSSRKRATKIMLLFLLMGLFLAYVWIGAVIGHRTIILLAVDQLVIALLFASLIGFLFSFARKSLMNKPVIVRIKRYFDRFWPIFCLALLLIYPVFDYYIYLMPSERKSYLTEYQITTPGPIVGRFANRCRQGIKIKEQDSAKWFFICFSGDKAINYHPQALVTIQSNSVGSYLFDYQLTNSIADKVD